MNAPHQNSGVEIEPDMSWIDIAVTHSKEVIILGYSEGWKQFAMEHWWEDTFSTDAPEHLAPGAYRWTGYVIGIWDEDEHIAASKGEYTPIPNQPIDPTTAAKTLRDDELITKEQYNRICANIRAKAGFRGVGS